MNKCFTKIFKLLSVGTIVVFLLWLLWLFARSLFEADPNIVAAIISVIGVIVLGIWSHRSTRLREINSRHFIEKKNAYMKFIEIMFDLLIATNKKKSPLQTSEDPMKKIEERMLNFKKELMVWGNSDVILALQAFESRTIINSTDRASKEESYGLVLKVDDLLRAIRKDLGHNDNKLKRGSLSGMMLIPEDREKILSHKTIKENS